MHSAAENLTPKSKRVRPWIYAAALLINVLVFACIGAFYAAYTRDYNQKLFNENINNVESLNAASANAAATYSDSMNIKIEDMVSYIRVNNLTVDDTVRYLENANTHPDRQLQLVLCGSYGVKGELSYGDYSGISLRRVKTDSGYKTVKSDIIYGSAYYDIRRAFIDVNDTDERDFCFVRDFTDPDTKQKCFAAYRHVILTDYTGAKKLYAVLLVINSQTALNAYNMQNEYYGQSTVLINQDGDYIIKNSEYRSANFYDYIINYNDLTLDKKAVLQNEIVTEAQPTKTLFYKNHQGSDCAFCVTRMDSGWYSVTCVPLSSFMTKAEGTNYFSLMILLFLFLFVLDGVFILRVGKTMAYNVALAERASDEANKANAAKSRFLSTMSHELRTPLNAIIGFVSLSHDKLNTPELLGDYLRKIDVSSKLLLQLISDILDISAIESNKMKIASAEFDISKLIGALSTIYYTQCAANGIEFNVVLKNIHSEILIGDSVRVNQVLLNFLSNAVKFTPRGGRVTLRAQTLRREGERVFVRFEVEDTGCGISDDMKTRLFEPFEREGGNAARRYSGTGLGLSIAKSLAELMDGKIDMQSTEGEGSIFALEIPFTAPSEESRKTFAPIEALRVLAVVSNPDEREYIGDILTNIKVPHTLLGSAQEAMELLSQENFNLCIIDWKMPDLCAVDATKSIRQQYDSDKVKIMVLAYDIAGAQSQSIDAGADAVLGKPVFSSSLYNRLAQITSKRPQNILSTPHRDDFCGKRVLLVEDNPINIEIAQLLLERMGLSVEIAENGKIACTRFDSSPIGYYNAILMDIQMPLMNGYDAAVAIRLLPRKDAKSVPILAMTADAFSQDVEKALNAGMNEHISKPIDPENLYETLKKYLYKGEKK